MCSESLNNIYLSNDLIILYLDSRVIRLWYYDVEKLKNFTQSVLDRYNYDCGIVNTFPVNNKNKESIGYLRLVYSNWFKYEDGKCIENLFTGDTINDTITLFYRDKETIEFKLDSYGSDELLTKLHNFLSTK